MVANGVLSMGLGPGFVCTHIASVDNGLLLVKSCDAHCLGQKQGKVTCPVLIIIR